MKTFTNCAEKKAKQFFNLLQGYTKGIRMTAILILLLMGVSNAWGADWHIRGTGTNLNGWDNPVAMRKCETANVYFLQVSGSCEFKIVGSSGNWGDNEKGGGDITTAPSNNVSLQNNNGNIKGGSGTWYICYNSSTKKVYGTSTVQYPELYVAGDSWSNLPSWSTTDAKGKMTRNSTTYTKTLSDVTKSTDHKFKIAGYDWGQPQYGSSNYDSNNSKNIYSKSADNDGNKVFQTYVQGDVIITLNYTTGTFTIYGPRTITLDQQSATTNGITSIAATYGATASKITSLPSKTGYTFGGYFTATNGGGTQVVKSDGSWVATVSGYTDNGHFAATTNKTLYAKWTAIEETKYDVTISANANGSVNPSGTQKVGASGIQVTATPNDGYQFKQWSNTGGAKAVPSNSATTTVTATANGSIKASFEEILYDITITSNNAAYGDVNPKSAKAGIATTVKIEATPVDGYEFVNWTAPGSITLENANNASTTITKATANGTVSAKFQEKKNDVIISYKCSNTSIRSDKTQSVGEAKATSIEAPEHTGYTFTGWTLGKGITNHSANTTTNPISITTNSTGSGYTLVANYTKNSYTFNLMQAEGGNATATVGSDAITSSATLEHGTIIALTATADDKYKFSKWVDGNGTELSTTTPYTHTLTASTTISPVFTSTDVLYLKPNENWKSDGAWFAAYFFKKNAAGQTTHEYWAKMKKDNPCDDNGHYKVKMPEGDWTHVIFCRMNSGSGDLNWNNKWNQTADLELPKNDNNCFAVKDETWDKGGGTWSSYTSKAAPLVFNVTVPANTPNCYIIGAWDGWKDFTEMTKVDDTHYTVSIPDACDTHGYKYCYGPSWGCQEVKNTDLPTQAISDRSYSNQDEVKAWIKYCLVGDFKSWNWNNDYQFTLLGDLEHDFDKKDDHNFKVMSSIGAYLAHSESYTYGLHRQHTSVKIAYEGGNNNQLILTADVAGNYKFHFDAVSKLLTIEFPEKGYRLKITMTDGSKKVYTSNAVDDETEILSFFAPGSDDTELSGTIILEQKGSKKADIPATLFKTSGVYTAKLNRDKNGITNIEPYDGNYYIRTDGANGGWGNYKTDSDNKMTYFVPREEEKYSYYWVQALPRASRDHTNGVVNVRACVANDYNDNLAVMLGGDRFTSDADGNVKIIDPDEHHREKINVRFGYNPKTNHFERAMLTGSGNINTFLNIFDPLPEGYLYKTNNNGTLETQLTAASQDNKFTDISNWVYERDVWVNVQNDKDVTVCLTAVSYNGARNSLFGFDDEAQTVPTQRTIVAKNSTQEPKKMRVIYDFKTNRMIMAWMPGAYNCTGEEALIADVLFMRHENDPVPQLTMQDNNTTDNVTPQIKGIQTQFFALELENKGNQNYEEHYWITLPFNCIVGSISGVPGYMQTWGIQRYNGKKRAEKGWWKETETFWEWLNPDDVMEAGVGYVLSFDKKAATWNTFDVHTEHDDGSVTTTQKSLLRLYFPSTEKDFTFKENNNFVKTYADEPCEIKTANRHLQDGNWKIIGPLSYNSATATASPTTGDQVWQPEENGDHITVPDGDYNWAAPMFLYEYTYDNSSQYNRENNWKYVVKNTIGYTYKAFFGYMVQFAGTMTWYEISQSIHPRLRARTYTDQVPTNITTNLDLVDADGVQHDQTFVALDVEGTTTYDLNKDLNKVFNSNYANIYTLSENIPFAGNTLPMEKAIVPVGVRVDAAGEYTFRMPDGTEGINVTLIDNQTGTQTDMLMSEYTVTLDAGTIENRFYLVVDPDRTATSVENIGEEAKGEEAKDQIKKFLIDGKLFIRTADGIFDAKGQRL